MAKGNLFVSGCFLFTYGHGMGAPWMEGATRRRIEWRRQFAFYGSKLPPSTFDAKYTTQQRARVGVVGSAEQLFRRRLLYNASEIHDDGSVGQIADHTQVVAYEEVSEIKLLFQLYK